MERSDVKAAASNMSRDHCIVPSSISLRAARDSDAALAEALYLGTMMPLLTALGFGDEEGLRSRFVHGYKPACSQFAQVRGRDVGWIQVSVSSAGLHLDQLHLVPGWRGRGIGSHLLAGLLDRAKRAGSAIALDVIRGNRAIGLYERLGFRVTGEDVEKFQMIWCPPR